MTGHEDLIHMHRDDRSPSHRSCGEWVTKRLDDLCDVDPENLSSKTDPDFQFNYISLEQVDTGRLLGFSRERFRSAPSRARRVLRNRDILMSTVRPNLMAHLLFTGQISDAICSTGFSVLRCREESCDSRYLYAHLFGKTINDQINRMVSGSNYPAINSHDLKLLEIPSPPTVTEQCAIAEALADVDRLLEVLGSVIVKKQAIKHAAMQQLFSGMTRLGGFSGDWKTTTMNRVGSTYGGLSGKKRADFGSGMARYVTFLNVLTNVVVNPVLFESVRITDRERQNRLSAGDLLFNGTSETPDDLAMGSVLNHSQEDLYLNSFCFGFRIQNRLEHYPLFFAYLLRSDTGRRIVRSLAQGATRYNISKKQFLELEVSVPTFAEQVAISTVISDMDADVTAVEKYRDKVYAVKVGMMQQLLTGRLRLNQAVDSTQGEQCL